MVTGVAERTFSVSEAAEELSGKLGVEIIPKEVSDVIYHRRVPISLCPKRGRNRAISTEGLAAMEAVFRELLRR